MISNMPLEWTDRRRVYIGGIALCLPLTGSARPLIATRVPDFRL
jgi:hypothetical protein